MPITTATPITVFDQEAFYLVDERVRGIAFDIHNEFGRYLDEVLYQGELARRCELAGLHAAREFQMKASLDGFEQAYFADFLIDRGVVVETKAASALSTAHKGQTLNYLFLCGLHHASLLNFGTERVEHQFVSTRLNHAKRADYELRTDRAKTMTPRCSQLREILDRCLIEWGAYLDPILYRNALTHFLGGAANVLHHVPVQSVGAAIGTQEMHLLTDGIAFSLTASTHRPESVFEHQRRFLNHTPLRAIQWINLNHRHIELRTIERA